MNLMQCTPDFLNICRYEHQVAAACDFTQIPRPYFNLAYILEGSGTLREEKASITVEAGDLLFIPAGSRYWGNWEKSKFITCHFLFPSAALALILLLSSFYKQGNEGSVRGST